MTKFLETVCKTVGVVLSTIFLPVRILMVIVSGIIEFPTGGKAEKICNDPGAVRGSSAL